MVATTVVTPEASGSNSMPPVATVAGDSEEPPAMVTVRLCAPPAAVTSCATPAAEFVTVATREDPAATAWTGVRVLLNESAMPTRTWKMSLAEVAETVDGRD